MSPRFAYLSTRRAWLALALMMLATTLSLGGCPDGGTVGDGILAGTWTGDVKYTVSLGSADGPSNSYSFTRSFTVTFSADGLPDTLDLALGDGEQVVQMPAATLLQVGDTAEVTTESTNQNTGEVTTTTVNVTVTSISRSESSFNIGLDVDVAFSGATTGTMAGTYSLQADAKANGTLNWQGSSSLQLGNDSLQLTLQVASEGTLARQ